MSVCHRAATELVGRIASPTLTARIGWPFAREQVWKLEGFAFVANLGIRGFCNEVFSQRLKTIG
jgi:hypothetical protein